MSVEGVSTADDGTTALTELERNALARADRLKQLRARVAPAPSDNGGESAKGDENGEPQSNGPLIFRSYQPIGQVGQVGDGIVERQPDAEKFSVVDRKIDTMIKDTLEIATISDDLDVNILAPKKVDWDLRRGLQPKLDALYKRTKKAYSQLLRKRLADGDDEMMPAAINATLQARNDDDEEDEDEL